jgi:ubiquinol-cytochrome c reductase cytochrome c subunit
MRKTMQARKLLAAMALAAVPLTCLAQGSDPNTDGFRAYMTAGCYECHGTVGQGGVGPRLAPRPMPLEAMMAFVRHSARSMPAYDAKVLSDADLSRIHAYLNGIAPSPAPDKIPELR